jgi:tetratricopeptide (TPR) repeat protein
MPDYDKSMAIVGGVMLCTLIFQPQRLLGFRPRWFDLPVLCWCFCPMISSLSNDLGLYDGLSAMVGALTHWSVPYLIGRLYFGSPEGIRELAIGLVIAGLFCILPCLYEMKMSQMMLPQVYGKDQWEGMRLGGYRPRLFFTTGLELGMWMTATSLTAVWLWKSGTLKRIGPFPFGNVLLPILLGTTVMCRSTGATLLLVGGLFILWFCSRVNSKALFWALVLCVPTYYAVRIPNLWSGQQLVDLVGTLYNDEKSASLAYRLNAENLLAERAMERPVWGWGGWGGNRVKDKYGRDKAATDGLWILMLGNYGCAGLLSWTVFMLLPAWLFTRRFPVNEWATPAVGPLAAIATLEGLYTLDCLSNGFLNPVYLVGFGGLICILPSGFRTVGPSPDPTNASDLLRPASQESLAIRYKELARTLKNQGQPAQAKAAWVHALDMLKNLASTNPGVPEFQRLHWDCTNDFAWFLLNEPDPGVGDPLMALRLAGEAAEANPECGTYWNTLGAASYRTGDATGAITALERSISLTDGGNAFDYIFLALAHAQLGQQGQARAWNARVDLWIQQHECHHPELSRLLEEVCTSLTQDS